MKNLITLLLVSLALQAAAQKTIEKSFEDVQILEVNLASGDCTLKRGGTSTVSIHLTHDYDTDVFRPEFEMNGNTLKIKEKFDGRSGNGFSKWTITIPNKLEVKVNSGSGDLRANDMQIALKSNSGSGDIELADVGGKIQINTGSGDVDAENHEGTIKVNTGSGDINFNGSGEVAINAGSGDIIVRNSSATFSLNTGSGDIRASSIQVEGSSSFNTGSGDASVALGKSLDFDISVNSGSGSASLDFNNNPISGTVVMKASKDNGKIVAPFDFDKVEELDNGNNTTIRKTTKIGSKDIRIQVSTGSGTARISK